MKLSQIGEFGLIERIASHEAKRPDTLVGIGDDAAVLKLPTSNFKHPDKATKNKYQLITTDALIEGVHFKRKGLSFFALGQKALAANISDIAAMGGWPTHALVTVGLPATISVEQIEEFYRGLNHLAKKHKIDIAGGDTVASPREFFVSITLLGEVEKENLLLRSTAKPGDLICVTGKFGGPASQKYLRLSTYNLRLAEARMLAKTKIATSLIDSSDGLVRSVIEICKASKAGARIWEDKVPKAKGATLAQALYGGEEYELVFTVPKKKVKRIKVKMTIVGEVMSSEFGVKLIDEHDKIKPLKSGGYEHFLTTPRPPEADSAPLSICDGEGNEFSEVRRTKEKKGVRRVK
jgi:thiamine-monophosphate kinase